MSHRIKPNAKKLQRLCDRWAKRLALSTWEITVAVVPFDDLDGRLGTSRWSLASRQAYIRIYDPTSMPEDYLAEAVEMVLIHELLHVCLAYWTELSEEKEVFKKGDSTYQITVEDGINTLARVLHYLSPYPQEGGAS